VSLTARYSQNGTLYSVLGISKVAHCVWAEPVCVSDLSNCNCNETVSYSNCSQRKARKCRISQLLFFLPHPSSYRLCSTLISLPCCPFLIPEIHTRNVVLEMISYVLSKLVLGILLLENKNKSHIRWYPDSQSN